MILEYVMKFHFHDCLNILSQEDILGYYSIKIDFLKLFETWPDIGDSLLCKPIETLPKCNQDLIKAQNKILENDDYSIELQKLPHKSVKIKVHARFFGLPVCPELHRTIFPKNVDLGCFLKVTGTVVRVTQSKMLEYHRKYVCLKCKHENIIEADFEHRYVLRAASKCSECNCTTFDQVNLVSREHCKDYQEIKIQEQVNKLNVGTIPGSMWIVLDDDLVDCCKPGDDVNICGTVRRRWRPSAQNKKSEVELVLQANYVEVCNTQRAAIISTAPDIKDCFDQYWTKFENCPMKGRDLILNTVCPQVYGLHLVKLALLLTVITGSNHIVEREDDEKISSDDGHKPNVRGQCHLLLVGDPGTGKSQMLRAAVDLTPRSVFTSGAGSTRAGLTCSALREDGEWQLEAGALVLSDGGVCCIDEISQLKEHDRASIHEAMEQQTISIAKAGIVCKLNTRCAIVAACNPKGHYDIEQNLSVNVSLGTPLLSRFDLIFILLDSKNSHWDKLVSSYILFGEDYKENNKSWSVEKLQMYISLVGPRSMEMTKSANVILQTYYIMQRRSANRDPSRTTVRMLDSLVRLSQAHCRLMYRTTILPMDAIVAISLVDLSMQDCTLKDTVDALHSTFPQYPDFDYLITAKRLLTRLNLYEIWNEELLYYGLKLNVDRKTLENDIDNGLVNLFAKFDDVSDDNIQLSSTFITSSYFNNKRNTDNGERDSRHVIDKENENKNVNDRLAVTLKKHASINKEEEIPSKTVKRKSHIRKRKRNEIVIETNVIRKDIAKKVKKTSNKKRNKKKRNESDNSSEESTKIELNNVPSVNDEFNKWNINFNFDTNSNEEDEIYEMKTDIISDNVNKESSIIREPIANNCISITREPDNSNKAKDKLKRFQFTEKHDLDKFYNENVNKVITVQNIKKEPDPSPSTHFKSCDSMSGSQLLSIFETSDCDVELDI